MCDFGHEHGNFGFLVDAPDIRSLIFETRRLTAPAQFSVGTVALHGPLPVELAMRSPC
jgi:hypothetical protein